MPITVFFLCPCPQAQYREPATENLFPSRESKSSVPESNQIHWDSYWTASSCRHIQQSVLKKNRVVKTNRKQTQKRFLNTGKLFPKSSMMTLQHPEGTMRALSLRWEAQKPGFPLSGSWLKVEFLLLMGFISSRQKLRTWNAESVVRVWREALYLC